MHKLGHFWLTFCPKICIFLRYYYESAFFSIGRTQINVIISCSYPEVNFDHTRHDIFAHLARQQAFFLRNMAKVAFFGPWVKTALRPPPSALAENQFSALFPGNSAENYFPPRFRSFSGKRCGKLIFRPQIICTPPPKKN